MAHTAERATWPRLGENAERIYLERWSLKDDDLKPTETWEQSVDRVALNVASVNALYAEPRDRDINVEEAIVDRLSFTQLPFPYRTAFRRWQWMGDQGLLDGSLNEILMRGWWAVVDQAEKYETLIGNRILMPNSPTWTGAGTPLGQLAACFVLDIDDDLTEGPNSIFQTMRVAAAIEQTGGGNGFNFGRTRPYRAVVKRSKGQASGPVGWLLMYDSAYGQIGQGGVRSGANMGVLPIHHPDVISRFDRPGWVEVKAKASAEGYLANFNISLAVTDDFMTAVVNDDDFDLRFDGMVYETLKARDLMRQVAENAWVRGDPGNLFIDRANRDCPCPTRYWYEATNPCGEQFLPGNSNCCLGSINIGAFASWDGTFDWDGLAEAARTGTQFLDDVIDANQYVPHFPQLAEMAYNERRIGLGGMGLADALLKLGIRYGSTQAIDFAGQVTEWMRYHSMLASIERAAQRGPFPWIGGSIYDPSLLSARGFGAEVTLPMVEGHRDYTADGNVTFRLWRRPRPVKEYTYSFDRPVVDWSTVENGLREHGIRNATQFTWVPTGTTANVAECEGNSGEPVFAFRYTRKVIPRDGSEPILLPYLSPLLHNALLLNGLSEDQCAVVLERLADTKGSVQSIDEVPASVREVFVGAADVPWTGHVWMQAALQAFTDNAISKTINMPNEATVEDVEDAYKLAHELGCKGITIYREGSRSFEILSVRQTEDDESDEAVANGREVLGDVLPMKVPDYAGIEGLPTRTYPVPTPFGTLQVYITERVEEQGRPFDLRVSLGKAGSDKSADVEAIGRLTSIALRARVPVSILVEQLEGIGGRTVHGMGPSRVLSVADALAKLLKRIYLGDNAPTVTIKVEETFTPPKATPRPDPSTVCPKCGNATVVVEAGCRHCDDRLGGCGQFSVCD